VKGVPDWLVWAIHDMTDAHPDKFRELLLAANPAPAKPGETQIADYSNVASIADFGSRSDSLGWQRDHRAGHRG